jgi:nucleoid DNA-binding protein
MNLAKEISFLLYKHSCVILPGFGAFLVNEKDAECNETAKYATPRQKVVSFNRQIINNDGLLANYISTEHECSYDRGLAHISDYIKSLWDVLLVKRNVELPEIGTFYFTTEEKLVFVPYLSVNFDVSSYGLPKLRLKMLEHTNALPAKNQLVDTATVSQEKTLPIALPKPKKTKVPAKVEPVLKIKRKDKNLILQTKKSNKTSEEIKKKRKSFSSLAFVNVVGSLFLVVLAVAMFNFEQGANKNVALNLEVASLMDTPGTAKVKPALSNLISYGIYAQVANNQEATELTEELLAKYSTAELTINQNGETEVFILSFSNEGIAKEYKTLLQNKLNQKLVIKQK